MTNYICATNKDAQKIGGSGSYVQHNVNNVIYYKVLNYNALSNYGCKLKPNNVLQYGTNRAVALIDVVNQNYIDYINNAYQLIDVQNLFMLDNVMDKDKNEWTLYAEAHYDEYLANYGYGGWSYRLYIIQTEGDGGMFVNTPFTIEWNIYLDNGQDEEHLNGIVNINSEKPTDIIDGKALLGTYIYDTIDGYYWDVYGYMTVR